MRSTILLLALSAATAAIPAQVVFEKQASSACPIPAEHRPQVEHLVQLALPAAQAVQQEHTRSQLLEAVADANVCLEHFEAAARLGDAAYPAGSEPLSSLGNVLAEQGQLTQAAALEKLLTHGTHAFLAGIAEGLAAQGKFAEANVYVAQIPDDDVRFETGQSVLQAMYKAGQKTEALAAQRKSFNALPAEQRKDASLSRANLDLATKAEDWPEARRLALAAGPKESGFLLIAIAAAEADAHAPSAHEHLLASAHTYNEHRQSPPSGYLLSSRLASLRDYPAAMRLALAVHDDEWNERCWATIAMFQAEDGKLDDARKSIARIGRGAAREHKLDGMEPSDRDMARGRVANILIASGHAADALTFLDQQEDKDTGSNDLLSTRIAALANLGEIDKARSIVEGEIARSSMIGEDEQSLAVVLVRPWYRKDPAAAEKWVAAQKSPEILATAALALAAEASGSKPEVYHYFVNWD